MPPNSETREVAARDPLAWAWWILLALVVATALFVRIRLLEIPFERDEGEYAYAGQLLLHGIPPYKLAYNMKFPGTYAAYALFMAVFGQTPAAIHLALIIMNFATAVLLFLIARRLTRNLAAAAAAAATYNVMTLTPGVLGLATHIEQFVLPPALAAIWLLLDARPPSASRTFVAGLLFGIAVLMKQPALFFLVAGVAYVGYLAWQRRARASHVVLLFFAATLPIVIVFALLWAAGVFPAFWFWTIKYARAYGSIIALHEGVVVAVKTARQTLLPLWPICSIGVFGFLCVLVRRDLRRHAALFALLGAASLAALSSGFYFREHYYIYLLAFLSLGFAVALAAVPRQIAIQAIALAIVSSALAYPVFRDRRLFFSESPEEACREIYRGNIFADAPRIGAFLRSETTPDDAIAVVGSEPEIYFYVGRRSATGYIYTYGLMEEQPYARQMQQDMQREIEVAQPKFLVFVSIPMSWGVGPWSDLSIFNWVNNYTDGAYQPIGAINMLPNGESDYCLPCGRPMEAAPSHVVVFKRVAR